MREVSPGLALGPGELFLGGVPWLNSYLNLMVLHHDAGCCYGFVNMIAGISTLGIEIAAFYALLDY